jgi:uncharacterized membrane protein YadS
MPPKAKTKLLTTEDYWAIWLGMLVIALALGTYFAGQSIAGWAVTPGGWSSMGELAADLAANWTHIGIIFLGFGVVFTLSMWVMGRSVPAFVVGYTLLFLGSTAIFYLAGWQVMKKADLGAPLLALLIGLILGNFRAMPEWFKTSLRTEYYIKTGIVLLGATLPMSLIFTIGPIAFLQATIVSVTTWLTIYLAATRLFKLDRRFGAVLGAGGAVCGVSGSIAVGGAVRADKEHISIGIAVVSVWAIVMILVLTVVLKFLVPDSIAPGVAGAWVGTSEYADAAGFAVVAELAHQYGEGPIRAFTLMKVIGRDIWIGIWCLVLSFVSVVWWEKREGVQRVGAGVIWERFPKFVIGFFVASLITTAVSLAEPTDYHGVAPFAGSYKDPGTKQKTAYAADFSTYRVPAAVADRFTVDAVAGEIRFRGRMDEAQRKLLKDAATTPDQKVAIMQLAHRSNWYESDLSPRAIKPIMNLRSWAFVLCFLCIGLSTRFRELMTFGLKPFWAFTIGVLVNVPLGFVLSNYVFVKFWAGLD